ncbi:MAG: hypothetical protein M0D55_20625 [Elusimicrobiota bacterium]|nr:MAG: hypothetical protein M0D55_20625 [Elusimicrobiota bacterium]
MTAMMTLPGAGGSALSTTSRSPSFIPASGAEPCARMKNVAAGRLISRSSSLSPTSS